MAILIGDDVERVISAKLAPISPVASETRVEMHLVLRTVNDPSVIPGTVMPTSRDERSNISGRWGSGPSRIMTVPLASRTDIAQEQAAAEIRGM